MTKGKPNAKASAKTKGQGRGKGVKNLIGATNPNADTRNANIVKKNKWKERHIHTTETNNHVSVLHRMGGAGLGWLGGAGLGWAAAAMMVIRSEWSCVLTKACSDKDRDEAPSQCVYFFILCTMYDANCPAVSRYAESKL